VTAVTTGRATLLLVEELVLLAPDDVGQEPSRFVPAEAQVGFAQLGDGSPGAQAREGQRRIGPSSDDQVEIWRDLLEQKGEPTMDRLAIDHVVVVQHENDLGREPAEEDQGIGVLVIDRQGELPSVVTPPAPAKISLRRAQYTAELVEMARDTLLRKIAAQEWAQPELHESADIARREARAATTCDELRLIEGRLATCYWLGWRDLQVTWKGPGIPEEWRRFETRSSWNGTLRHARNPVNAALNLAYYVLAGRIERAIVARGLDPAVGSLHTERDGRNSLTYDLIEALRPRVDVKLMTWMGEQTWRRADFTVDTAGVVRLHPALARVIVQVSQLPENLIEGEVDHYLALIRAQAATREPIEQAVGS
jgi:CRISPR-associated protein Cas1